MVEVHKAGGDTLENIMAPYITLGTLDSFVDLLNGWTNDTQMVIVQQHIVGQRLKAAKSLHDHS